MFALIFGGAATIAQAQTPDCVDEALKDEYGGSGDHAMAMPGIGKNFVWTTNGEWVEHADGTTVMTGLLEDVKDANKQFFATVTMVGRTQTAPAGSPKKELPNSAYAPNGPVDPTTWDYYDSWSGVLEGAGTYAGAVVELSQRGPAFQVGEGANNKNGHYGGSGWFSYSVVSQPNSGNLKNSGVGDFNVDIGCAASAAYCIDEGWADQYGNNGNHAMWLPGIATDFIWDENPTWFEYANGTAEFTGVLRSQSNPSKAFEVTAYLADRTTDAPPGSPKKELKNNAYAPNGPIDTNTWYYYPTFTAGLVGLDDYAGAEVELLRTGPAFQVGDGANGKNINFGASAWFDWIVQQQPTSGNIKSSGRGDFNLDLGCDDGTGGGGGGGEPWCPRTPGFWKNHLDEWPVTELSIGGITYNQTTLLSFLNYGGPDMTMKLARQLTATKLNLLSGSLNTIQTSVDGADAFLVNFPPGSNASGADKDVAELLKDELDAYNNSNTGCDDGTGTPAIEVTKADFLAIDHNGDTLANPGDVIEYSITVESLGTATATNVTVEDPTPAYTNYIPGSATTTWGTIDFEDPLTVAIGDMEPGESVTITFQVQIDFIVPLELTEVSNQATVTADGVDPEPSDDPDTPTEDDPTDTPIVISGCYAKQPIDVVYLLDLSGSMTSPFPFYGNRLAAAQSAILASNAELAARGDGSRAALVTFAGFWTVEENLANAVTVHSDFTTDLGNIDNLVASFDAANIMTNATTPTAMGLEATLDLFVDGFDPLHKPMVVWITDGVPNIDSAGRGPEAYQLEEIQAISLYDQEGEFLSWPEVALLGNLNFGIETRDGEVLANAMYFIEQLKVLMPDLRMFGVALQGDGIDLGTFNEGLVRYSGEVTGGDAFSVSNSEELQEAVFGINHDWECGDDVIFPTVPSTIGDLVWNDLDADGIQDDDEEGFENVVVRLLNSDDAVLFSTLTDANGNYLFENLPGGSYQVQVDTATIPLDFVAPTYDADGLVVPHKTTVLLNWSIDALGIDFGYREPPPGSDFCVREDFEATDLSNWAVAKMGDAFSGGAQVVNGALHVTANGTSLFHAADNAVFAHQRVQGDFRVEMDITDFPVDQGGLVRKAGLMVRESTDAFAPRVMVNFIPHLPDPPTTALQFDVRIAGGATAEVMADLVTDLSLPVRVAIIRQGDVFSIEYSTNDGLTWLQPSGALGGTAMVPMSDVVLVGAAASSYDSSILMTAEMDNLAICGATSLPTILPPVESNCTDEPLDVVYVVDRSGSMRNFFQGAGTRLAAAQQSILQLNADLAARGDGSRAAVVSFEGANNVKFNLAGSVSIDSTLTSDFAAVDAVVSAYDPNDIGIFSPGPTPIALEGALQLLLDDGDTGRQKVVVLITDGVANVDIDGQGPDAYTWDEINAIGLTDGNGDFLLASDVALLGNFNADISTYDGKPVADTMVQLENLVTAFPTARFYGVALQGTDPGPFNEDFIDYGAALTGGLGFSATTGEQLITHMGVLNSDLTCE